MAPFFGHIGPARPHIAGGELTEGIAVDVTEEGALLVRVEQDSLITVHAGDIEHLRIDDLVKSH